LSSRRASADRTTGWRNAGRSACRTECTERRGRRDRRTAGGSAPEELFPADTGGGPGGPSDSAASPGRSAAPTEPICPSSPGIPPAHRHGCIADSSVGVPSLPIWRCPSPAGGNDDHRQTIALARTHTLDVRTCRRIDCCEFRADIFHGTSAGLPPRHSTVGHDAEQQIAPLRSDHGTDCLCRLTASSGRALELEPFGFTRYDHCGNPVGGYRLVPPCSSFCTEIERIGSAPFGRRQCRTATVLPGNRKRGVRRGRQHPLAAEPPTVQAESCPCPVTCECGQI